MLPSLHSAGPTLSEAHVEDQPVVHDQQSQQGCTYRTLMKLQMAWETPLHVVCHCEQELQVMALPYHSVSKGCMELPLLTNPAACMHVNGQ